MAGSVVDFGGFKMNPAWTVILPFGAVAYGLFLISFMLENESAMFDQDKSNQAHLIYARVATAEPKAAPVIEPTLLQLLSRKSGH